MITSKQISYIDKVYELTKSINDTSKFVSDGNKVFSLVNKTNFLGMKTYNVLDLESNALILTDFVPLRQIKAWYEYNALPTHAKQDYGVLYAYGIVSDDKQALLFYNKHNDLYELLCELESANSEEKLSIIISFKHLIDGSTVVGNELLTSVDKYLNQIETIEYIKDNTDSLGFITSSNIDNNALYHTLDDEGYLQPLVADNVKELEYNFVQHIYWQRKGFAN